MLNTQQDHELMQRMRNALVMTQWESKGQKKLNAFFENMCLLANTDCPPKETRRLLLEGIEVMAIARYFVWNGPDRIFNDFIEMLTTLEHAFTSLPERSLYVEGFDFDENLIKVRLKKSIDAVYETLGSLFETSKDIPLQFPEQSEASKLVFNFLIEILIQVCKKEGLII